MDPIIEEKMKQYKMFITHDTHPTADTDKPPREDNLSRVIHSEEDAEMFMAQVNCLIDRARRGKQSK